MRRIPDILIAIAVIAGAVALSVGFRKTGVASLLVAMLIGFRRNWCIGALEELLGSSEHQAHDLGADVDTHDGGGDDGHAA